MFSFALLATTGSAEANRPSQPNSVLAMPTAEKLALELSAECLVMWLHCSQFVVDLE